MRITLGGEDRGQRRKITYHLFDVYDRATGVTSMARTTGYVCNAVAHLVLRGRFSRRGICPPEHVGREEGCLAEVLEYLQRRNVTYRMKEERPPDGGQPFHAARSVSPLTVQ